MKKCRICKDIAVVKSNKTTLCVTCYRKMMNRTKRKKNNAHAIK